MEPPPPERLHLDIDAVSSVSALASAPADAWAGFVFAHGAGAGMTHDFMARCADGLAARGIATLRYQFPFMERGSRRPDGPAVAHAASCTSSAGAAKITDTPCAASSSSSP